MNRVTRMGIGLVTLIPVLGLVGSVVMAMGFGAEAGAWIILGLGLGWLLLMVWWAMRAPPARSANASDRYWVALRHARYPQQQRQHRHDHARHGRV